MSASGVLLVLSQDDKPSPPTPLPGGEGSQPLATPTALEPAILPDYPDVPTLIPTATGTPFDEAAPFATPTAALEADVPEGDAPPLLDLPPDLSQAELDALFAMPFLDPPPSFLGDAPADAPADDLSARSGSSYSYDFKLASAPGVVIRPVQSGQFGEWITGQGYRYVHPWRGGPGSWATDIVLDFYFNGPQALSSFLLTTHAPNAHYLYLYTTDGGWLEGPSHGNDWESPVGWSAGSPALAGKMFTRARYVGIAYSNSWGNGSDGMPPARVTALSYSRAQPTPTATPAPLPTSINLPGSADILLAALPAPNAAHYDHVRGLFAAGVSNPRRVTLPISWYGTCNDSNRPICARYAYVTFYAYFKHYTGAYPTVWDLMAATLSGELGLWGRSVNAAEALSRNFFNNTGTGGGCPYNSTTQRYICDYETLITWTSGIFWIERAKTENGSIIVNAPGLLNLTANSDIDSFQLLRGPENTDPSYTTLTLRRVVPQTGMFALDDWLRSGGDGFPGVSANLAGANWRTGQGPDRPSTWGNMVLTTGATTFTGFVSSEQFEPLIIHNFFDPATGRTATTVGAGNSNLNTTLGANPPLSPYCTYVAVLTTTQGRISISPCPRPQ